MDAANDTEQQCVPNAIFGTLGVEQPANYMK